MRRLKLLPPTRPVAGFRGAAWSSQLACILQEHASGPPAARMMVVPIAQHMAPTRTSA